MSFASQSRIGSQIQNFKYFNSDKMFDLEHYITELRKSELNDVPEV